MTFHLFVPSAVDFSTFDLFVDCSEAERSLDALNLFDVNNDSLRPTMFSLNKVFDWICVSFFVLGLIGNLLGLIVFSSRRFRCCSTYSTLALTSFTVNLVCIIRYSMLLHSTTRKWLSDKIVAFHWINCKVYRSTSSIRVVAAWLTVFWVVERFVYVSSRLNFVSTETLRFRFIKKYRYSLMIFIVVLMLVLVTAPTVYFYSPIIHQLNGTSSVSQCTFDSLKISRFWFNYFTSLSFGLNYQTVRFLFSELIPSILVGFFNIGIIIFIVRTTAHVQRRRRELTISNGQISSSTITGLTSKNSLGLEFFDQTLNSIPLKRFSTKSSTIKMKSAPLAKMSWMNIVLILHSFLFFFSSTLTSLVFFSTSHPALAYWMSVIILGNCSLNFYVYCLSGEQFRTELRRIATRYFRQIHKRLFRRFSQQDDQRHPSVRRPNQTFHSPILRQQRL